MPSYKPLEPAIIFFMFSTHIILFLLIFRNEVYKWFYTNTIPKDLCNWMLNTAEVIKRSLCS